MNARGAAHNLIRLFALALVTLGPAFLKAGHADDRDQQARQLLASRCAICHSADLIQQQRLPRDRWEATVTKMVHWGAQLDDAERAMLVAYLTKSFPPDPGPVGRSSATD